MTPGPLVLSLFPGIGLLDMAFEQEGFCVVRGPDLLWGGDIRTFHPPAGRFDGVIGGPPCQAFSTLAALNRHLGNEPKFGNLIPEFERVVSEAAPAWFLMENVPHAPVPILPFYLVMDELVDDASVGGITSRMRRFTFGGPPKAGWSFSPERLAIFEQEPARAVTGDARIHTTGHRVRSRKRGGGVLPNTGKTAPIATMAEQQGLPGDFFGEHSPFTHHARRQMLGNGVPLAMGRAVAKAVKRALNLTLECRVPCAETRTDA